MDPQGRLLLEQSGLALADAGGRLGEAVASDAGVYVGVMHMEYIQYMIGNFHSPPPRTPFFTTAGVPKLIHDTPMKIACPLSLSYSLGDFFMIIFEYFLSSRSCHDMSCAARLSAQNKGGQV